MAVGGECAQQHHLDRLGGCLRDDDPDHAESTPVGRGHRLDEEHRPHPLVPALAQLRRDVVPHDEHRVVADMPFEPAAETLQPHRQRRILGKLRQSRRGAKPRGAAIELPQVGLGIGQELPGLVGDGEPELAQAARRAGAFLQVRIDGKRAAELRIGCRRVHVEGSKLAVPLIPGSSSGCVPTILASISIDWLTASTRALRAETVAGYRLPVSSIATRNSCPTASQASQRDGTLSRSLSGPSPTMSISGWPTFTPWCLRTCSFAMRPRNGARIRHWAIWTLASSPWAAARSTAAFAIWTSISPAAFRASRRSFASRLRLADSSSARPIFRRK